MDRDEFDAEVCSRVPEAAVVPFVEVHIGDWKPRVSECHQNVDYWVSKMPGHTAVRGWIKNWGGGNGFFAFTPHSVVQNPEGELFDITPVLNEDFRLGATFIRHYGDDGLYRDMTRNARDIFCLGTQRAPRNDPELLAQCDFNIDGDDPQFR